MFLPMETALILALMYLAFGAACFAYPRGRASVRDFSPASQVGVFFDTLPLVLTWPIALWRLLAARF
jgi:hypothetical protein